ncbi:hypothetical protein VULLAG_LOCUS6532 [Vulpes lagopus]
MTVLTKAPVLSVPLWASGEGAGLGRGRPPGIWASPPRAPRAPQPSPHTPSPESSPARAGLPGSWHGARLAAERGQRGGASGGGAEDVAGRPGRQPDPGPASERGFPVSLGVLLEVSGVLRVRDCQFGGCRCAARRRQ